MKKMDEREEAVERTYRYYEIQGVDPPDCYSIEWREMFSVKLKQVREEENLVGKT